MIEWPLLVIAGLVGSSHCLGMCGPLALTLGAASRSGRNNLARQLIYTSGRLFTYGVLGAAAGFGGEQLAARLPGYVNAPALLAIVAGFYLIYQGLLAAGVWPQRLTTSVNCGMASSFRTLLTSSSATDALLAGMFTGLIPCGLLYGMLALAASTHSALLGGVGMIAFGLGTLPAMLMAGFAGTILSIAARRKVFAIAAWCLVLTGAISVVRGATHLEVFGRPAAGCPMCVESAAQAGR